MEGAACGVGPSSPDVASPWDWPPACAAARLRREHHLAESPEAALDPPATSARRRRRRSTGATTSRPAPSWRTSSPSPPGSAELHYLLGKVLQLQVEITPADAEYRKALALEPQYVGALIGLGQIAARLGRPQEALGRFDAAIDLDPPSGRGPLRPRRGPGDAEPARRRAGGLFPRDRAEPGLGPGDDPGGLAPARPGQARPGPRPARPGAGTLAGRRAGDPLPPGAGLPRQEAPRGRRPATWRSPPPACPTAPRSSSGSPRPSTPAGSPTRPATPWPGPWPSSPTSPIARDLSERLRR